MDILTQRLRLRTLENSDAEWITKEIANPNVHQWLTAPPRPYTLDNAQDFIARNATDAGYRVICMQDRPRGIVSLSSQKGDALDLGYWLAETAWGQGIMSEAAAALVGWHFDHSRDDLRSGWIPGNAASQNVLKKLGFDQEEVLQAHSGFHGKLVPVQKARLRVEGWQALSAQT